MEKELQSSAFESAVRPMASHASVREIVRVPESPPSQRAGPHRRRDKTSAEKIFGDGPSQTFRQRLPRSPTRRIAPRVELETSTLDRQLRFGSAENSPSEIEAPACFCRQRIQLWTGVGKLKGASSSSWTCAFLLRQPEYRKLEEAVEPVATLGNARPRCRRTDSASRIWADPAQISLPRPNLSAPDACLPGMRHVFR